MFKLIPKYITEQPSLPMPVGPTTQEQGIMHRPQRDHINLDQFVPPRIVDIKKHAKHIGKFIKKMPVKPDRRHMNPPPSMSPFERRRINTEHEINRMLDEIDADRGTVG